MKKGAEVVGSLPRIFEPSLSERKGDRFHIFDGSGALFLAEILDAQKTAASVRIIDDVTTPTVRETSGNQLERPSVTLTVAVAMPKSTRSDWLLGKLTELAVDRIVPLAAEHSVMEAGAGRVQRWQNIVVEASKQCERLEIPELAPTVSIIDFLKKYDTLKESQPLEGNNKKGSEEKQVQKEKEKEKENESKKTKKEKQVLKETTILWGCMPDDPKENPESLFTYLTKHPTPPANEVVMLVGPEGDFSREEKDILSRCGGVAVTLSRNRLRVETAALVFASSAALAWKL